MNNYGAGPAAVVRCYEDSSYAGRLKLAISDEQARMIESAMFDLNALTVKHDSRALAAACLSKAAYLYQQLRMLGHETPQSLEKIFNFGLNRALEDGEKARVLAEVGPATAPKGKAN